MASHVTALIVGGGPAGSTAATLLARAGVPVLLLEGERFPREHIGESLLPATLSVLDSLGVLEKVRAAGFTTKRGATMRWGLSQEPWSWYFSETNQRYPTSFQVWRPAFDEILLRHSRSVGAEVREGVRVQSVLMLDQQARGVRLTDGREITTDILIDASGQRCLLGRQLQLQRFDELFRNLAVYAYFENGERLASPNEGNIYIESYEHGWCWNIPLTNPRMNAKGTPWSSVGVVVDRDRALPKLRAMGAEDFLADQLGQTRDTAKMLAKAEQIRSATVLQDWSYRCAQFAGSGWVLAGDAACFIDPLFSTGVHLAMSGGFMAAALGNTALAAGRDADLTRAAALTYERLYVQQYEHFHRLAQLFYSANRTVDSYFWEARRWLADQDFSPRESFVRAVSGQAPIGYERSVLAQGALPESFTNLVEGLNEGRRQRRDRFRAAVQAGQNLRLRVESGVSLGRDAVLGESDFCWGEVIRVAGRDESIPCSAFVANLLRACDGTRSLHSIAEQQGCDLALVQRASEILVVDGLLLMS